MGDISRILGVIDQGIKSVSRLRVPTKLEMSFQTYVLLLEALYDPRTKDQETLTHISGLRIMFNPKVKLYHVMVT